MLGTEVSTHREGGQVQAPLEPWTARMVHPLADQGVGTPASFIATAFALPKLSGNERLRISALGLYRCFINGRRVGNEQLTPGWTCYDKRLSYQSYDIADLLLEGENSISIWIADGWYRSQIMWAANAILNCWGDRIAAIAEIRGGDGEVLLATDDSWRGGELPIVKSGLYFGEIYDARREELTATAGCEALDFDTGVLVPHETAAVRELPPLAARASRTDDKGRTTYDFGQNSAGYVALTVRGSPGSRILVEHAEITGADGEIDIANLRSAEARVEYILKGGGAESYRPHFTFQGFRYARVTAEGDAEVISIAAVPITSAGEPAAGFSSANPLLDRLVQNTLWSLRSNFIEAPTDCPQRDERLGWTGDAQVFAGTACYLNGSESFLRKWLRDVMADQREDGAIAHVVPDPTRLHPSAFPGFYGSTGWGDVICVMPWVLWCHYGDPSVLEETLPAMVRWVDFVWSISNGPIVSPPRKLGARGFTFGDWLQPSGPSEKPLPTCGDDMAATLYLYISSTLAARAARVIGNGAVAQRMEERAEAVREAFAREFVTSAGRLVYDDQTSYALAILYDLIPPQHAEAAKGYFKAAIARSDGRIGTGFIGTPALLPALVKIGELELAAQLLLQENAPGWLYQIKTGATTIWERWDAIQPDGTSHASGMNSFNHYAYGAVCQFLFEALAGFRPDPEQPGFEHIIFEPMIVPALSPLAAHHDSRRGRIEAAWTVEGDEVSYALTVPEGATGTFVLKPQYSAASLNGQPLDATENQRTRGLLAPGKHLIRFRISRH